MFFLGTNENITKLMVRHTVKNIINGTDFCYDGYSNQKISAVLKKLVAVGMAKKSTVHTGEMITVKTRNGNKQVEKIISLFSLA